MNIPFWKMHGAANDFILVDDRDETFPVDDHEWIARMTKRNTGVGSEGIANSFALRPSTEPLRLLPLVRSRAERVEIEMCVR